MKTAAPEVHKKKAGRPRKYPIEQANAGACAAYREKKTKKGQVFNGVLDIEAVAALNSLKAVARAPNRTGKIISKALVFYAKFKLRGKQ